MTDKAKKYKEKRTAEKAKNDAKNKRRKGAHDENKENQKNAAEVWTKIY